MELENKFKVPVGIEEAWALLLDVERVALCLPGATLESVDGDDMTGRVKVKLGPIAMTYKGSARFVDRDDVTHSIALEASGKDVRGAGGARAKMRMNLADLDGVTECTVKTELAVTGKPAQFGRGVMADVSANLVDEFARRLADEVQNPQAGVAEEPRGAPDDTAPKSPSRVAEDDAINLLATVDTKRAIQVAAPAVLLVSLLWFLLRRRTR